MFAPYSVTSQVTCEGLAREIHLPRRLVSDNNGTYSSARGREAKSLARAELRRAVPRYIDI